MNSNELLKVNVLNYYFLITILLGNSYSTVGQSLPLGTGFDFKGRYIVAVSDADMVASAYKDGQLGPVEGHDALSVIRLDKPLQDLKAVQLGVSNSVTGPPSSVAVSPDGRYAVVIETLGPRPAGQVAPLLKNLPAGKAITVIDLANPDQPKQVQCIDGPNDPQSVEFNADGSLLAIACRPIVDDQSPLVIYRFIGGKLTNHVEPVIPGWGAGDQLQGAVFHPKQDALVLLNASKATLFFVKITPGSEPIRVSAWGKPVLVEQEPCKAQFTPDGRFLIVNTLSALRGSVWSVRLAIDSTVTHEIVSRGLAGVYSEGLTISPNGQWVVTANLEQSFYPLDSPKQGFFSSLSLLHLDPELGLLERVGDFPFSGILAESVVFDNSSRFLAVSTFDHYNKQKPSGSIDIWRLTGDYFDPKRRELVKTSYSVPVTRGVHSMVIVR